MQRDQRVLEAGHGVGPAPADLRSHQLGGGAGQRVVGVVGDDRPRRVVVADALVPGAVQPGEGVQGGLDLPDRAAAIAALREAVRFRPNFAGAFVDLGRLLLESGDREAARQALETAALLDPDDRRTKTLLEQSP